MNTAAARPIMTAAELAEARLAAAHPRAARDPQLAAMLDDIRDTAACLTDPDSSVYGPEPARLLGNTCLTCGETFRTDILGPHVTSVHGGRVASPEQGTGPMVDIRGLTVDQTWDIARAANPEDAALADAYDREQRRANTEQEH